jgi:hypothetical protein
MSSFKAPNIDMFINDDKSPAIVRLTAMKIRQTGGFTLGHWLLQLSMIDLQHLLQMSDDVMMSPDKSSEQGYALMGLAVLLSTAEGLDLPADTLTDVMRDRLNVLMMMLSMERLNRLGVITFDRSKATLSLSEGDVQQIAKLREM